MSGSGPLDPPVSWGHVADLRRELVRLGAKDGPQATARMKVIRQALAAHGIPEEAPDSGIVPYYTSPDGMIVVYHARWEDVLAAGLIVPAEVALVHADPPYGIGGANGAGRRGAPRTNKRRRGNIGAGERVWPALVGGNAPFDPSGLLDLRRPTVLWGANHYDGLPGSPSWLTWDKRPGGASTSYADVELAWSNLGGPARLWSHDWSGVCRASESGDLSLHPTQKPIALCSWVYARAKLKRGDLVFVPYMGSGPDLAACVAMGLRCIACEVEEEYCRVAVGARLHAAPVVESVGPLFGGAL